MRNMSCMLTTQQVIDETKTETRRLGWWFLMPGDVICLVKKGMGLKKGEKIEKLKTVKIISRIPEPLEKITKESVIREGFPDKTPDWFIDFFCKTHKNCKPYTVVNVIRWEYIKI